MQYIYIDAVGGVAGDMFIAAVLDGWPELKDALFQALEEANLHEIVRVAASPFSDGILTGTRFQTAPTEAAARAEVASEGHGTDVPGHHHSHEISAHSADAHAHGHHEHQHDHDHDHAHGHDHDHDGHGHGHGHRDYAVIREWLSQTTLPTGARDHAASIFRLLAEAEGAVHGIAPEDVTFHEVGAWDSIADIVAAGWLIDALGPTAWHCAPLPLGRGRVQTAHGELPIPAPATALLLEGFEMFQDGRLGERITPTGAAILKHLQPSFEPMGRAGRLLGTGTGFGAKRFPGISNILRLSRFEARIIARSPVGTAGADAPQPLPVITKLAGAMDETIVVCHFEVDDQTPEDLGHALDVLRAHEAVKDVVQIAALGKKNRLTHQVQLLVDPNLLDSALALAFDQTATLGIRWQTVNRAVLGRRMESIDVDGHQVRVKTASRPGGVSAKAEHDDIAGLGEDFASRQLLRRHVESASMTPKSAIDTPTGDRNDGVVNESD